jgi:hypothetical protein
MEVGGKKEVEGFREKTLCLLYLSKTVHRDLFNNVDDARR